MSDVDFVKIQVVTDDGDEWGRRESGQEASEEGDPGEVEAAHVGCCEAVDSNRLGLVLRVHQEREFGSSIRVHSCLGGLKH